MKINQYILNKIGLESRFILLFLIFVFEKSLRKLLMFL
jgi:hypothetical protein